ncbi:MAG: hypothetical protein ABIA78_03280 [archaeon]
MTNAELLKELEKKFEKMKNELGFKASLDELERIFYIKDDILKDGYVSEALSRQICHRIVDTYGSWANYLHSIIMPNPQNILNMSEAKIFSQEEKKEVTELMKNAMQISSNNSLIGLNKDKVAEAKFIDYAVEFWDSEFGPKLIKIMKKIKEEWEKE